MRDSLRDCQTGDIKIKPFLRRQERLRMIFKKTRDAFGCEFQHKTKGGSLYWFTTDAYFEKFGSSYNGGEQFCASRAMRLCTFEEYCPNGEFGETHKTLKSSKWQSKTPEGEIFSELYQLPGIEWQKDSWAPFYDPDAIDQKGGNVNNWVQVGFWKHDHVLGGQDEDKYNKQCWVNPWGKPWGLTNDGMVMKHGLCCAVDTWKF